MPRISLSVVLLALVGYFFVGFVAAIGGLLALAAIVVYTQLPSTKRKAKLEEARAVAAVHLKTFVFNAEMKKMANHRLTELERHFAAQLAALRKRAGEWQPTLEDIDRYIAERPPGPPPEPVGLLDWRD